MNASALPDEPVPPPAEPPTLDELGTMADVLLFRGEMSPNLPTAQETFAAVVLDFDDDVPEEERRADLRRALGPLAPDWAVELGIAKGTAAFEGETGELIRDAVTIAFATDRGPVLRRLARHLLEHGVNRFVALALLHGWSTHLCAPAPPEDEIVRIFERALKDGNAT